MKKPDTVKKTTPVAPAAKSEGKKATSVTPASKVEKISEPKAPKKEAAKELSVAKACEAALAKLKELNIDESLQAEIQWCLGSYSHDQNPAGLYQMAKRSLAIFTVEKANKTKGITPKLISDLEKAIGNN